MIQDRLLTSRPAWTTVSLLDPSHGIDLNEVHDQVVELHALLYAAGRRRAPEAPIPFYIWNIFINILSIMCTIIVSSFAAKNI